MFDQARQVLKSRSPKVSHPRAVNSRYLLSGLVFCGNCGATMIGSAAKSSSHFYYACQNYTKRGKKSCDAKLANKDKIETFVIAKIRENILTEKNLIELVRIINEEMLQAKKQEGEELKSLDRQLQKHKQRLDTLYDALETGKLEIGDLAPRIKELRSQIDNLEANREHLIENANQNQIELLGREIVRAYVSDLKELLSKGTIIERKSFLKTFVKRIEIDYPHVTIEYTIPLETKKVEPPSGGVLPIVLNGSSGRTRTYNLVVNSHPLCRLSYRGIYYIIIL